MSDFTWNDDYTMAWAPTSDPRVAAVIQRDEFAQLADCDAPTLLIHGYGSRAQFTDAGESDNGARIGWIEAYGRWGKSFADRFVSVFYGTTIHHLSSSIDQYAWAIVFDSPEWRADYGIELDAELSRDDIAGDIAAYLNGDVYAIGYAVIESRVTDELPFDIDAAEVTIESYGYFGNDYAMRAALDFECGSPELETLIDWSNN